MTATKTRTKLTIMGRLFSAILTTVMLMGVFGIFSLTASAEEAAIIAWGDCGAEGSNVQWELDDSGTLTISGTGDMADYNNTNEQPWDNNRGSITSLIIEDDVTSIGQCAFARCTKLTDITISGDVTSIGQNAFNYCEGLTSITIPDSVTSLGEDAFYRCSGLTSLIIPDSVTSLGQCVFSGCTSLESIAIPKNVTSINRAFSGCTSLKSITIPESVTSIDGAFSGCTSLESITIPESVTSIDGAFSDCNSLKSITIPKSVTSIGASTFSDCTNLKSIMIPDSVKIIDEYAFSGCSGLESITIPRSVEKIGDYAFKDCSGLESITIPCNDVSNNAFDNCINLIFVTISCEQSEEDWKHRFISYDVNIITEHTLKYTDNGDGTHDVTCENCDYVVDNEEHTPNASGCTNNGDGTHSFECSGCNNGNVIESHIFTEGACTDCGVIGGYCGAEDGVTNLMWTLNEETLTITGEGAMADYSYHQAPYSPWYDHRKAITKLIVGEGVTTLGESAFHDCTELTEVILSDTVESLGEYTFFYCTALTEITLSDSVTSIGEHAFQACTALMEITLPDSVASIGKYAFQECFDLTEIVIPEGVEVIQENTFQDCFALKRVTIPASVTSIATNVFSGCNALEAFAVAESSTDYKSVDGVLFTKDGKTLVQYPANKSDTEYIVPDGAETTREYAFQNAANLTVVTIPDSVTSLGEYTFFSSKNLKTLNFGTGLTAISSTAFYDCNGLTTVNVPCNWNLNYNFGNATLNYAEHSYENSVCIICDATCDHNESEHITAINNGNGTHSFECSVCGTTVTEDHNLTYSASGNTITATCAVCNQAVGTATITAEDAIYTGSVCTGAGISGTGTLENQSWTITYTTAEGSSLIDNNAVNVGSYMASITLGEGDNAVIASDGFVITAKELRVTGASATSRAYDGTNVVVITGVALSGIVGSDSVSVNVENLTGTINSANVGDYTFVTLPTLTLTGNDATNYSVSQPTNAVSTNVTISKAENVPNVPENNMMVPYGKKTVGAVTLPTGWTWQEADKNVALPTGSAVTATAIYVSADKDNYKNTTAIVKIIRNATCDHSNTEVRGAKAATYSEAGYTGDTYCVDCDTLTATGESIPKLTMPYIPSVPGTPSVPSSPSVPSDPTETEPEEEAEDKDKTESAPQIGDVTVADGEEGKYQIKATEGEQKTVAYMGTTQTDGTKVVVPHTVEIAGETYQVTEIRKGAFRGNTEIEKVVIGKQIEKIGKNAFRDCENLKTITIKSRKLTAELIGKNAFEGLGEDVTFRLPGKKFKEYKEMLLECGVSPKATFKKIKKK